MIYKMLGGENSTDLLFLLKEELRNVSFQHIEVFATGNISCEELSEKLGELYPKTTQMIASVGGVGDYTELYYSSGIMVIAYKNKPNIYTVALDDDLDENINRLKLSNLSFLYTRIECDTGKGDITSALSKSHSSTSFFGSNFKEIIINKKSITKSVVLVDFRDALDFQLYESPVWEAIGDKEYTVTKRDCCWLQEVSDGECIKKIVGDVLMKNHLQISKLVLLINDRVIGVEALTEKGLKLNSYLNEGDVLKFGTRLSEQLKDDFLDMSKKVSENFDSNYIITCLTRVNIMLSDGHFMELEHTKEQYFKNTNKIGFGYGASGCYLGAGDTLKFQSNMLGMCGMREKL